MLTLGPFSTVGPGSSATSGIAPADDVPAGGGATLPPDPDLAGFSAEPAAAGVTAAIAALDALVVVALAAPAAVGTGDGLLARSPPFVAVLRPTFAAMASSTATSTGSTVFATM